MATDENNHKNEARDDWTGCTFRVERGPSSEGRASAPGALDAEPRPRLHGAEDDWWHGAQAVRAARPRRHGAAV